MARFHMTSPACAHQQRPPLVEAKQEEQSIWEHDLCRQQDPHVTRLRRHVAHKQGRSPLCLSPLYFFRSLQDARARGCGGLSAWGLVVKSSNASHSEGRAEGLGMLGRAWAQALGELVSHASPTLLNHRGLFLHPALAKGQAEALRSLRAEPARGPHEH